jgi:hypothetical protein
MQLNTSRSNRKHPHRFSSSAASLRTDDGVDPRGRRQTRTVPGDSAGGKNLLVERGCVGGGLAPAHEVLVRLGAEAGLQRLQRLPEPAGRRRAVEGMDPSRRIGHMMESVFIITEQLSLDAVREEKGSGRRDRGGADFASKLPTGRRKSGPGWALPFRDLGEDSHALRMRMLAALCEQLATG